LASVLCLAFAALAVRKGRQVPELKAEALLFEEAVVTQPVAPGLEGMASLCRPQVQGLSIKIKATDASQAFARGDRVRIIDVNGGVCIVESVDQEHRAR
jgi:membrane protein implicated in regulation of membrane protease activity